MKDSVKTPIFISRSKASSSGRLVSAVKLVTGLAEVLAMATTWLLFMSSRDVLGNDRNVLLLLVARSSNSFSSFIMLNPNSTYRKGLSAGETVLL